MLDRQQAMDLLMAQNPDQSLVNHSLMSEAVMRGLAEKLGRDVELWGLIGLLHDVDFAHTKDDPDRHGLMAMELLSDKLPEDALTAIRAHNDEYTGQAPTQELDYALRCGESVTGLVAANALVRPEGMAGMKPKSLKKKMKQRAFAANVSRDIIGECERLGLDQGEFFQIAIDAIAPIAGEVGLSK